MPDVSDGPPRDSPTNAEDSPSPLHRVGVDAWALCAEFVERIVSEAQAAAARDKPGWPAPKVDCQQIWRAGEGAPSDEAAIGRIVHVASEMGAPDCPGALHVPDLGRGQGISEADVTAVACEGTPLWWSLWSSRPLRRRTRRLRGVAARGTPHPIPGTPRGNGGGSGGSRGGGNAPCPSPHSCRPPAPWPVTTHVVADADEPVPAPVERVPVPEPVTRVVSTSATFDSATLDRARPAAAPRRRTGRLDAVADRPCSWSNPPKSRRNGAAAISRMGDLLHLGPQCGCHHVAVRGLATLGDGHFAAPGPGPAQVSVRGLASRAPPAQRQPGPDQP